MGDCPACEVPATDRPALEPDRSAAFSDGMQRALAAMATPAAAADEKKAA